MPPRKRQRKQATSATAQRGYGRDHQARRKQLLAALSVDEGQPCARCGEPMFTSQDLDADHTDPRALNPNSIADRLLHSRCNRQAGVETKTQVAADREADTEAERAPLGLVALIANRAERQRYCARDW